MPPTTNAAMPAYLLDEYVALTERWCRVRAHRLNLTGENGGALRTVVYTDRTGVVQPLISPYLGFQFTPSKTEHLPRIARQWHEVANLFVVELRKLGWRRWLTLPPDVTDARPFSWTGALVSVRYTYCLWKADAADEGRWESDVRRRCRKVLEDGYTVERNEDIDALVQNVNATENKQEFQYTVTRPVVEDALKMLGAERLRIYNVYDKSRQPASSLAVLHAPGTLLQAWLLGTAPQHLRSGASQLVWATVIRDIVNLDCTGLDMTGANFPSLAAAKSQFGCALVPYYQIEPLSLRYLARAAVQFAKGAKH